MDPSPPLATPSSALPPWREVLLHSLAPGLGGSMIAPFLFAVLTLSPALVITPRPDAPPLPDGFALMVAVSLAVLGLGLVPGVALIRGASWAPAAAVGLAAMQLAMAALGAVSLSLRRQPGTETGNAGTLLIAWVAMHALLAYRKRPPAEGAPAPLLRVAYACAV